MSFRGVRVRVSLAAFVMHMSRFLVSDAMFLVPCSQVIKDLLCIID